MDVSTTVWDKIQTYILLFSVVRCPELTVTVQIHHITCSVTCSFTVVHDSLVQWQVDWRTFRVGAIDKGQ